MSCSNIKSIYDIDGRASDCLPGEKGDRAVNKNRKDKKNNPVFAVIVAVVILLMSAGGGALIIPLLIIGVMAYVIYTLSKQANQKESGDGTSSGQPEKGVFGAEGFDPKKLAQEAKRSFSKVLTQEMKKDDLKDCDGGHEHVEPSYNMPADEKRREQLKSMLQNGLIEKEEYKILMRKYGLK